MTWPTYKFKVAWTKNPLTVPGPGEWTDETTYMRFFDLGRGRTDEFDTFDPSDLTVVLDDRKAGSLRRFDRHNTASPLYPNVKPRKRCYLAVVHEDLDESALDFDGTTGDYALKSAFASWPTSAITVEMWLTGFGAASGNNSDECPLSYFVANDQFVIRNLTDLKVIVANGTERDTGVNVLGDKEFARHLAVVWRAGDGMLRVYVDGVMRYDGIYQLGASMGASGTLALGQEQDSAGGTFVQAQSLKGKLREVRIWSVARTQHAIYRDMHQTLVGSEAGLVSYYKVNEGAGTNVNDENTTNNNDLTITGATWATMAGDRPLFTGFIESIKPRYGADGNDVAQELKCVDALSLLTRAQRRRSAFRSAYRERVRSHGTQPGDSGDFNLDGSHWWSTPDAAALDITGDIDLRCAAALDDWSTGVNQVLVRKIRNSPFVISYQLYIDAVGKPNVSFSPDGTTVLGDASTVAVAAADGALLLVRATLDVDDGAGNRVLRFYTKTSTVANAFADLASDSSWTQLGATVTTAGTTSIFASDATLTVGASDEGGEAIRGAAYAAIVKNGINGTTVANPDFYRNASPFTDTSGRTWTFKP